MTADDACATLLMLGFERERPASRIMWRTIQVIGATHHIKVLISHKHISIMHTVYSLRSPKPIRNVTKFHGDFIGGVRAAHVLAEEITRNEGATQHGVQDS